MPGRTINTSGGAGLVTTAEQTAQAPVEDSSLEWTCRLCMYATVVS